MRFCNKFFISFLLVMSVAGTISAQTPGKKSGITFYLQAGPSYYHLFGRTASNLKTDTKFIINWHAGLLAQFPVSENFFIETGIMLQKKGGKNPDTLEFTNSPYRVDITYL